MMTPIERQAYRLAIESALRAGHSISDKQNTLAPSNYHRGDFSVPHQGDYPPHQFIFYPYDHPERAQVIDIQSTFDENGRALSGYRMAVLIATDMWCAIKDATQSHDDTVFHSKGDESVGVTWDHLKRKDPLLRVLAKGQSFDAFIRSEELNVAEAANKEESTDADS